jgi:hypothetical protein
MAEFIWQLRCPGVMSVFREDKEESRFIDQVYRCIVEKSKEFESSEFERHVWLNVTEELSLMDFYGRLLSNLQSDETVGVVDHPMEDMHLVAEYHKFVRGYKCLVVINGLGWKLWDMIKDTLLSEPNKGCILVITCKESLARHCVDAEDRAFSNKDLQDSRMVCMLFSVY